MHPLYAKIKVSLRRHGLTTTIVKILRYPYTCLQERQHRQMLGHATRSEIFSKIYRTNYWRSFESASGSGSTLAYTENLRKQLPVLFDKFAIRSIYDAPCGDFNWMREVIKYHPIAYHGSDIVAHLIDDLNRKYASANVAFSVADIVTDTFPPADLWLCRDCLFHLSINDIRQTLGHFIEANIPYLLTTTHKSSMWWQNIDIISGDHRLIDLFAPPFNFPTDVKYRIDDWIEGYPPQEMCLWTRQQVKSAVAKMPA